MTLLPSNSDAALAYEQLHPDVRRWIRDQGWAGLRDIQVQGVRVILDGDSDVVIAASTASGKTEAAFLPILTKVIQENRAGLSILYISPLKALINDQFLRLGQLCEKLKLPLVRWHGDAPQSPKKALLRQPAGIALITPESIEALIVRRPGDAQRLLQSLSFIIIDELHAFMAGPRGLHLASLLKRIDFLTQNSARRVGLSATIGDLGAAAGWLRPSAAEQVKILQTSQSSGELKLQIRGYIEPNVGQPIDEAETIRDEEETSPKALSQISDHLYATLRGENNLVFAGSRRTVEAIADGLRQRAEKNGVPNEFFPHHGSLAPELREPLEERLKAGILPTTAVCTSTLELGIDIGSVASVAQVGAPRSISSLRQRLGRSGRRPGQPAILRIYVREFARGPQTGHLNMLRPSLVRAVAAIQLLFAGFIEPANTSSALATGLLHQTLSIIHQKGGARAASIFQILRGPGPFEAVTPADFASMLRHVSEERQRLIEQAPDGTLMLAAKGEQIVQSREFFALFNSAQEWRLVAQGKTLGTIPVSNSIATGNLVVFAGRRWRIDTVDETAKTLLVVPHRGGKIPMFDQMSPEETHDRLVTEMRNVYEGTEIPAYLDQTAKDLLVSARETYCHLNLKEAVFVQERKDIHLFLWRGSALCSMLAVAFAKLGQHAQTHDFGLTIPGGDQAEVRSALKATMVLADSDFAGLSAAVKNLANDKFDTYIQNDLLQKYWRNRNKSQFDELREASSFLFQKMPVSDRL